MRATAEDLPIGAAATGTAAASGHRGDTTPPPPRDGSTGDAARTWLHARLSLHEGQTPQAAHVGFLCLQRSVDALEAAQAAIADPQAASLHLAIADQYRQIADVCGERGGSALTPPRLPLDRGGHIR